MGGVSLLWPRHRTRRKRNASERGHQVPRLRTASKVGQAEHTVEPASPRALHDALLAPATADAAHIRVWGRRGLPHGRPAAPGLREWIACRDDVHQGALSPPGRAPQNITKPTPRTPHAHRGARAYTNQPADYLLTLSVQAWIMTNGTDSGV
eukprot:7380871-Prymnesium_polylepis.1